MMNKLAKLGGLDSWVSVHLICLGRQVLLGWSYVCCRRHIDGNLGTMGLPLMLT